jgi:DNA polymerase III delta prime subunit
LDRDDLVWVEKYRPRTIDECILPSDLKDTLKSLILKSKSMPNLLFTGTAGVGKTSAAKAMINEMGADSIVINASKDRNIDTLRTKIQDYASTVSFDDGRKFVILDEADFLNAQSTQPALRNFMEEYASNCGFILTCNHENKIMEALKSRVATVHFHIKKEDQKTMLRQALERFSEILNNEKVVFDQKVLFQHIRNFYPDLRKALNELQFYINKNNTVDTGLLAISTGKEIDDLLALLKDRDFANMRKWVAENDVNMENLVESLFNKGSKVFSPEKIPMMVLILARYDYQNAFVGNKEINIVAMLTEIMTDVVD